MAVIAKTDLGTACEFDRDAALAAIEAVRPGMPVLETSAKTGAGLDAWLELLGQRRRSLTGG